MSNFWVLSKQKINFYYQLVWHVWTTHRKYSNNLPRRNGCPSRRKILFTNVIVVKIMYSLKKALNDALINEGGFPFAHCSFHFLREERNIEFPLTLVNVKTFNIHFLLFYSITKYLRLILRQRLTNIFQFQHFAIAIFEYRYRPQKQDFR